MKSFPIFSIFLALTAISAFTVPSILSVSPSSLLNVSLAQGHKETSVSDLASGLLGSLKTKVADKSGDVSSEISDLNQAAKQKAVQFVNLVNSSSFAPKVSEKADKVKSAASTAKLLAKPTLKLVTEQIFYPVQVITNVVPELARTVSGHSANSVKEATLENLATTLTQKLTDGEKELPANHGDAEVTITKTVNDPQTLEAMKILNSILEKFLGDGEDLDDDYYRIELDLDADPDNLDDLDDDCDEWYQTYGHYANATSNTTVSGNLVRKLSNGSNSLEWSYASAIGDWESNPDKQSGGSFNLLDFHAVAVALGVFLI